MAVVTAVGSEWQFLLAWRSASDAQRPRHPGGAGLSRFLREARYEAMTCPTTSGWCNTSAVLLKSAKPFIACLSVSTFARHVAGLALPFLRRQERKQRRRPGCLVPVRLRGRSSLALLAAMGRSRTHCAQACGLSSVQTAGPSQIEEASAEALAPMAAVLLSEA